MKRYVFRFRGLASETAQAVAAVRADHRLQLLEAAGRNLLVAGEEEAIREWASAAAPAAWAVAEEMNVPLPDTRWHPR